MSMLLLPSSRPALSALAATALGASLWFTAPASAGPSDVLNRIAGALSGSATEWTQLLNNKQLARSVALEGRILSTEAESLTAQLDQLRTQIQAYEIMRRNVQQLPDQMLGDVMAPILELQQIAQEAGSIAQSGVALDEFLRSGLITDPLFERAGLDRARVAERYDDWSRRWQSAVETNLGQSGLTMADVETEGQLLQAIQSRFGTEVGQMQVLQGANQISASMARQLNDLRRITMTQSEVSTLAWGRVLSDMDQREAGERLFEQEVHETLESLEQRDRGRSLNEIFIGD